MTSVASYDRSVAGLRHDEDSRRTTIAVYGTGTTLLAATYNRGRGGLEVTRKGKGL